MSARAVAALTVALGLAVAATGSADARAAAGVGQSAGAAAQTRGLPEAPGAEVARAACLGCHEADLIVSQRLSPTGWDREVAKMERWGAKVTPEQRTALVSYLGAHFGVRPMTSHDAAAVAAGRTVFENACRTCHEDDISAQQRLSAAAWGRTVDKMVRWGAKVRDDQKPALVAYLTSRWGQP